MYLKWCTSEAIPANMDMGSDVHNYAALFNTTKAFDSVRVEGLESFYKLSETCMAWKIIKNGLQNFFFAVYGKSSSHQVV